MSLYEGIKTAIIYGAGKGGAITYQHLVENGIEVIAFIDDFKSGEYFGKPIIKLEDLNKYKADAYFIGTAENVKKIFDWASKLEHYVDKERILYSPIPACDKNGNKMEFFSPPKCIDDYINLFEDNDFKKDLIEHFDELKEANKNTSQKFISFEEVYKLFNMYSKYVANTHEEDYAYPDINFDVEEGDVVFDCGANSSKNVNINCLYFAKKAGKNGKVYAFEPIPRIYNELLEDVKGFENIIPVNKGVSDRRQTVYVKDLGGGSRIDTAGDIEVELISIDEFVKEHNISKVDFIKMDIEGAELDALKGTINTIKTFKPKLAISIYHKPEDFYEIPTFIKSIVPEYKIWLLNNESPIDFWNGTKAFCKV
jgi:FkbM family methyltransferase